MSAHTARSSSRDVRFSEASEGPPPFCRELCELFGTVEDEIQRTVSGTVDTVPGLYIPSVGGVSVPLTDQQAKGVIQASKPSTNMLDEKMKTRNAVGVSTKQWELAPHEFELRNPSWTTKILPVISESVKNAFKIPDDHQIRFQLKRLVVIEAGCESSRYETSEAAGSECFGTVVIAFPSDAEGGELVISRKSKSHADGDSDRVTIPMIQAYALTYAAFSSRCEHQVEPVRSGYSLALIYNISCSGTPPPSLLSVGEWVSAVKRVAERWQRGGFDKHPYFIYPMGQMDEGTRQEWTHRYAALAFRLGQFSKDLGLEVFLGLARSSTQAVTTAHRFPSEGYRVEIPPSSNYPLWGDFQVCDPSQILPTFGGRSISMKTGAVEGNFAVYVICPTLYLPEFHWMVNQKGAIERCFELLRESTSAVHEGNAAVTTKYLSTIFRAIEDGAHCVRFFAGIVTTLLLDFPALLNRLMESNMSEWISKIPLRVWESTDLMIDLSQRVGITRNMYENAAVWVKKRVAEADSSQCGSLDAVSKVLSTAVERQQFQSFKGLMELVPEHVRLSELRSPLLRFLVECSHEDRESMLESFVTRRGKLQHDEQISLLLIILCVNTMEVHDRASIYTRACQNIVWAVKDVVIVLPDCLNAGQAISRRLVPDILSRWLDNRDVGDVFQVIDIVLDSSNEDKQLYIAQILTEARGKIRISSFSSIQNTIIAIIKEFPELRPVLLNNLECVYRTDASRFCWICTSGMVQTSAEVLQIVNRTDTWNESCVPAVVAVLKDVIQRFGSLPFGVRLGEALLEANKGSMYVVGVDILTSLFSHQHVQNSDLESLLPMLQFVRTEKENMLFESFAKLFPYVQSSRARTEIVKSGIDLYRDDTDQLSAMIRWIPLVSHRLPDYSTAIMAALQHSVIFKTEKFFSYPATSAYNLISSLASILDSNVLCGHIIGSLQQQKLSLGQIASLLNCARKLEEQQSFVHISNEIVTFCDTAAPRSETSGTPTEVGRFLVEFSREATLNFYCRVVTRVLTTFPSINWWSVLKHTDELEDDRLAPIRALARANSTEIIGKASFNGDPFVKHTPNPEWAQNEAILKAFLLNESQVTLTMDGCSKQEQTYLKALPVKDSAKWNICSGEWSIRELSK